LKNQNEYFLIAIFLVYNFAFIFRINFPNWSESLDYREIKGNVCSNFPALGYLNCNVIAKYSKIPSCEKPVFFPLPE